MNLSLQELEKLVNSELTSKINKSLIEFNELLVEVSPEELLNVLIFLKSNDNFKFRQRIDIAGVDFPEKEKRFQFADYKTSAYHEKAVIINLSKKTNKVINDVMPYLLLYNGGEYNNKWYKTSYNIPLIRNINTGKKAERYNMTKLIHNIFKHTGFNITINSLRKINTSED